MDQNFNRLTNTLACTCCIRKARYIPLYTPSIDDEWEQWEKARGRTRSLYECEREGLEKRNVEREKEKEREKKEQEKDGNALKCKSWKSHTRYTFPRDPSWQILPLLSSRTLLPHSTFLSVILLDLKRVQLFFEILDRTIEISTRSRDLPSIQAPPPCSAWFDSNRVAPRRGNEFETNLSCCFFLSSPPAITTRSLSTSAGPKRAINRPPGSDWTRDRTGIIFTCVYRSARTYVRARQSGPFARELRKAMQARTTREPLVPSYVLTSISLLCLSPFLSIVPLPPFLSRSLSLPFSPTPLSSSLALNHTCPPSLSPFLTFTFLSPSHCIDPPLPPSLSLSFSAPRYASSVLRSFSLFRAQWSFFIPIPTLISFVYPFPLSLSLSLLFSRYIPSSRLFSCPCSPPYASLTRSLSLYLVSRLTLYLRPAFSLSFIPSLSVRSSQPHHSSFLPSNFPHPPLYRCIPLLALRLLPATHSSPSLSLFLLLPLPLLLFLSLSIEPFYRCTLRLPSLSPFLILSLSLSPSCFEHRRSTFFLAVCPPSPSRVHRDPSYPRFAETCSRGFRSSPFDPRLLSFNMSRGPFYSSPLSRNDEPGRLRPTYFVFGNAPGTWNRSDVLAFEEPSACAARSINGHW